MQRAQDTLQTTEGPLEIVPIHHATLLLLFGDKAIYLDPIQDGNYEGLPTATHILITHAHFDHLDSTTLDALRDRNTTLLGPKVVAEKVSGMEVVRNGERRTLDGFSVEAVPMYNLQRGPGPGRLYHEKGVGNGYVFSFADKRVFVSGDTEAIPEVQALKDIDIAFLSMNLPYTMTASEAAACLKAFHPRIAYPYHYRGTDPKELQKALQGSDIEVRLRDWY